MNGSKNDNVINEKTKPLLRFEFVGMLFALAIGQVAFEIAYLLDIGKPFNNWYYSLSHLILATLIITMSWIGWQSSKSLGNSIAINTIFSIQFIVLLLDVTLVVIYYIIANTSERFIVEKGEFEHPSAISEVKWTMVIFGIYFLWDLITKFIKIEYKIDKNDTDLRRIYNKKYSLNTERPYLRRILVTLLCFLVSIYLYNRNLNSQLNGLQVVIVDLQLFLLFLAFRGWKQKLTKNFRLKFSEIPNSLIMENGIIFEKPQNNVSLVTDEYHINVQEPKWRVNLKVFLYRWLPILLILVLEYINRLSQ